MNSPLPAPTRLRAEWLVDPLALHEKAPRMTWVWDHDATSPLTGYELVAASSEEMLDAPDLWSTGWRSLPVIGEYDRYEGMPLNANDRAYWRVRVRRGGDVSDWSDVARFGIGLIDDEDWGGAKWVAGADESDDSEHPVACVRTTFELPPSHGVRHDASIRSATLFLAARGIADTFVNGTRAGHGRLQPGWTDFGHRIQYVAHDVSTVLHEGVNCLAFELASGWYSGHLGWEGQRCLYGTQPSLRAVLRIEHTDRSVTRICSNEHWRASLEGPRRSADLYMGELIDARRTLKDQRGTGWLESSFDDRSFDPVVTHSPPHKGVLLIGKRNESVAEIATLRPISVTQHSGGEHIVDFGQNLVGAVRLRLCAAEGTTVTLRHAEMLQEDGSLYTANLRSAKAIDTFICAGGDEEETFEPRFTFHGFRYVGLSGLDSPIDESQIEAVVLMSESLETGSFECDRADVNRLHQNIVWGQRGNFVEVPTDCPQRDERLGWTGDAQVFIPTASFNMDVAAFFGKWFDDLEDAQHADGAIPHVAPDVLKEFGRHKKVAGAAAWAEAAVICPWTIYTHFGDRGVLARHFDLMQRWVDWCVTSFDDFVGLDVWFGDWLSTDATWPYYAPTPREMIGTAYLIRCADLVAKVSDVLDDQSAKSKYLDIAARAREVFRREFVTPSDRLVGHTQTGYALAISFELCPEVATPILGRHFISTLKARDWKLSSGFVGTPLLAPALTRIGRTDLAYRLLLNSDYPSWLYSVRHGATTIWERWDSWTPEKGFGDIRMNSFNHYAYGSIGQWMYQTVLGINPQEDQPGYAKIHLNPQPSGGFRYARGAVESVRGRVASAWEVQGGHGSALDFSFRIPQASTATVTLPARRVDGIHPIRDPEGLLARSLASALIDSEGRVRLRCEPGEYRIRIEDFINTLPFDPAEAVEAEHSDLAENTELIDEQPSGMDESSR
ncbi:MAG: family 78 glycoside hydrolase catalytic domain [Planctomycetota bacterium]